MQLIALGRLHEYMGKSEIIEIVNSFIYVSFNYCSWIWHIRSCESIRKIEKIQKRCLTIVLGDYETVMKFCSEKVEK